MWKFFKGLSGNDDIAKVNYDFSVSILLYIALLKALIISDPAKELHFYYSRSLTYCIFWLFLLYNPLSILLRASAFEATNNANANTNRIRFSVIHNEVLGHTQILCYSL